MLANVGAIQRRFNMTLALHWYEWQCGFSDLCVQDQGAHRFKFDTEYPDYFPPRRGDGFRRAVDALREQGVFTFPYINGRIFDNNSKSFVNDNGTQYIVKQTPSPTTATVKDPSLLIECKEAYGSKELDGQLVYFDVADPTTSYWQDKYAEHVEKLVNESHVAGVYIDQLCAGSPIADFSPGRNHGVGGGAWWRKGLVKLLSKAHDRSKVGGQWAPLVVESNAEFIMDQVNGLLTLVAFMIPFASPNPAAGSHVVQDKDKDEEEEEDSSEEQQPSIVPAAAGEITTAAAADVGDVLVPAAVSVLAPAFPAIYGGYYVGFGSIYTHNDLALNPDVLASRMARPDLPCPPSSRTLYPPAPAPARARPPPSTGSWATWGWRTAHTGALAAGHEFRLRHPNRLVQPGRSAAWAGPGHQLRPHVHAGRVDVRQARPRGQVPAAARGVARQHVALLRARLARAAAAAVASAVHLHGAPAGNHAAESRAVPDWGGVTICLLFDIYIQLASKRAYIQSGVE